MNEKITFIEGLAKRGLSRAHQCAYPDTPLATRPKAMSSKDEGGCTKKKSGANSARYNITIRLPLLLAGPLDHFRDTSVQLGDHSCDISVLQLQGVQIISHRSRQDHGHLNHHHFVIRRPHHT